MLLDVCNKLILVGPHDDLPTRAVEMCLITSPSSSAARIDLNWTSLDSAFVCGRYRTKEIYHRSRTRRADFQRPTQISIVPSSSCSSGVIRVPRCSGSPSSTTDSQLPQ